MNDVTDRLHVCRQMYGRLNFIMGFTNAEEYKAILRSLDSSWMNITPSPHSTKDVVMSEENKM